MTEHQGHESRLISLFIIYLLLFQLLCCYYSSTCTNLLVTDIYPLLCIFGFIQTWWNIFLSREEFSEHLSFTQSLDVQRQPLTVFGSKAALEKQTSCNYEVHNKSLQKIQPGSLGYFFPQTPVKKIDIWLKLFLRVFPVLFLFFCHRSTYAPHIYSVNSNSPPRTHKKTQENSLQTACKVSNKRSEQ